MYEQVEALLEEFTWGDIQASSVIGVDGTIWASTLPPVPDITHLGQMLLEVFQYAKELAAKFYWEDVEQVFIKGNNGWVITMPVLNKAILVAVVRPNALLGLVFRQMEQTIEKISTLLTDANTM